MPEASEHQVFERSTSMHGTNKRSNIAPIMAENAVAMTRGVILPSTHGTKSLNGRVPFKGACTCSSTFSQNHVLLKMDDPVAW